MPMVLSMVPLYSLGQNDQNEVQHDFFGHVMSLMMAFMSCDANGVINGTITPLEKDNWNEVQHHFWPLIPLALLLVSCYANSVVNGTITFLRSTQLKWHAHPHYVMLTASSMTTLYSFGHDDQNKVQHDFSGFVT